MKIITKLLIFFFNYIYYVNSQKVLNAIGYSPVAETPVLSFIINEFNEYSKLNNLNITINLNLINPTNSTTSLDNYCLLIDSILNQKSNKYDIIFYNNVYSTKFEPLFIDLRKWLPQTHIQKFKNIENNNSYLYNNKLVGIPVFIYYTVLYNNMELLNKYNKDIPKTWDEMLETGKFILEQEKKNNRDILIYNGGFSYDEIGMSSIYEFIYTFRDNIGDPFPNLRSQNSLNALKMMKKFKQEIASDQIFQDLSIALKVLRNGNGLFIKQNHINYPFNKVYKISVLPGHKEGISGSLIGGDNIGINKYISQENIVASVKALMYITSEELQKKVMIKYNIFSGIDNLYEEKEICYDMGDLCDLYKNIQSVERPISKTNDYSEYSEIFRSYIYKYLYGKDNEDPEEILKKIDDIISIYYISMNSTKGKIIGLICMTLSILILLSSIFLFIKKFEYKFCFLSKEFWVLSFIGYVLLIYTVVMDIEMVTKVRCHHKILFQFIGFTFIFIPILHKLISNFPEENKISNWINNNSRLFVIIFLLVDISIFGLMYLQPYKIKNIIVKDGRNIQRCKIGGSFSHLLLILSLLIKIAIFFSSLFLMFLEWNLKAIYYDIRYCISAFFIDGVFIIIINIFSHFNIKNYYGYFILRGILNLLIVITNYFLLYIIRLFWFNSYKYFWENYYSEKFSQNSSNSTPTYLKKFNYDSESMNPSNINYINNNNGNNNYNSNNKYFNNNKKGIKDRYRKIFKIYSIFMEYHFRTEIESIKIRKNNARLPNFYNSRIQASKNHNNKIIISKNCKLSSMDYKILIPSSTYLKNQKSSQKKYINYKASSSYSPSNNIDISQLRNTISNNNNNITSSSNTSLINDNDISSSNTTLSPSNNNISSSNTTLSPSNNDISSSSYTLSPNNNDISSSSNALLINNHDIPSSSNNLLINNNDITSSRDVLLSKEELTLLILNQEDITDNLSKK